MSHGDEPTVMKWLADYESANLKGCSARDNPFFCFRTLILEVPILLG
jgi:hypothetical protein